MGIAVATYTECVFVLAGQHYTYICTQKTESRQNTEMLEHQKTINMCILHWHWGYYHTEKFFAFLCVLYIFVFEYLWLSSWVGGDGGGVACQWYYK